MMSKNYIENALNVIQYLLDHSNHWFSDKEIYSVSPRYGKRIIDNLLEAEVIISTKDGLLFDEGDVYALNSYLSELSDELENIKKSEQTELLNKIGAITNIIEPLLKIS